MYQRSHWATLVITKWNDTMTAFPALIRFASDQKEDQIIAFEFHLLKF